MRNTFLFLVLIFSIIGYVFNTKQTMEFCLRWKTHDECMRRNGCYWNWIGYECYPLWYNPNPVG